MEQQLQNEMTHKESKESYLHKQLRERVQQIEDIQEKLQEMGQQTQQVLNFQRKLSRKELECTEKEEREENLRTHLEELQQQLREKEKINVNLQTRLNTKNQQLEEKIRQEENLYQKLRAMEEQISQSQTQLREKESEKANLLKERDRLKRKPARTADKKRPGKNELERSLSTAQQILRDNQAQRSPDWVIPRNQIQLTTKSLGRGAWGEVVQGRFCGCVVAVKTIHDLILSPHNRRLFEREMDIASRCRHPCLLQFIGATNDDHTPLFLTEIMETSLRALLQERFLSQTEITVIALDVARGLNYLHQKRPIPILHRDISSANVLLWRQGTQWRAKVSDYGTANFKKQTMTVAPGALIYSAPEARATNQTVHVDVYSFGVLLCEMSIRELPDPERREQQVAMLANNVLRALIRGCLETDPQARPTMEEIINEIEPEVQGTF
ncbi:unnamed protein product [Pocillopora meandrina]|uniref:Protein kinase domain-containing protein n=1 Tax=Pocillopora meandrina TaxID=46732 RepID=A0AAU9XSA7_9CNID|nr:unnamed protein product [Pocillopora meandrina]